jgi:putative transcriptional regulator
MAVHVIWYTSKRIRKEFRSIVVTVSVILLTLLLGMPLVGAAFPGQHAAMLSGWSPLTVPSLDRFPSGARLASGKFLVASRHLTDPNFSESVVLLIEYNQQGAMGVVINQPTEVRLSTVLPDMEELQDRTDTVYIGGPVAREQMLLLIRSRRQPEGVHRVFEDVYVSASRVVLKQMMNDSKAAVSFRVYAGYAGWAPGQLDHEVARGDWHVLRAEAKTVFETSPTQIWPELIQRGSEQWVRSMNPNLLARGMIR